MAKVWTTKEGREIPIRTMEDSHLLNTIRMLKRNFPVVIEVEEE